MKTTLHDNRSPADICKEHGWKVGTWLIGDEGYGPTVIRITAIGKNQILAERISHNGQLSESYESPWVLWNRDWQKIKEDTDAA